MRIHYVHTRPLNSEEANIIQVLQMCKSFADLGHEVVLSVPEHSSSVPNEDVVKDRLGINSIGFNVRTYRRFMIKNRLKSMGCIPGSLQEVGAVKSDLLFIRVALLLPFLINKHPRVIFEIHNNRVGPQWFTKMIAVPGIAQIAKRNQLKAFVTISAALGQWWGENGVPANKLLNLHDGVDLERFSSSIGKNEARKALSLPINGKIVVYTGSLYRDRGMERLLRLAKDLSHVHFVVVGGPVARQRELEASVAAQKISNIHFMGHRPQKEIPLYLASADVLLALWSKDVPTINYCSPLKLFEYLASGRIIVADGFPTIREVMTDGEHGFLVDPESYDKLHAAVSSALAVSDSSAMTQRAESLARQYSWKIRCQNILDFVGKN